MQLEQIDTKYMDIIEKLRNGMKFGLFDKGMKCYFQDGTHISYNDLWRAIRIMNNIDSTSKSLFQLCPETFVGAHTYKHNKHNWKKTNSLQSSMGN